MGMGNVFTVKGNTLVRVYISNNCSNFLVWELPTKENWEQKLIYKAQWLVGRALEKRRGKKKEGGSITVWGWKIDK